MRYRQISSAPETGTVERVTIVPLLPDGTLGALLPADDGAAVRAEAVPGHPAPEGGAQPPVDGISTGVPMTLIHGEVAGGEDWLTEATVRIAATQAGLEIGGAQVVAAEGLPDAQHLIVWAQGWPSAQYAEYAARLEGLTPGELRRRVPADQGIIPGGASAAWIVADVAATIARRRGTS